MSGDDRFDHELRSGLRDLASEAVPERLVSRVAAIPSSRPDRGRWGSVVRLATGLAAAAVLVLAAGVLVLTRPSPGPLVGESPGASPAPSQPPIATSAPTATPGPSAAPSVAPTAAASGPAGGPLPAGLQVFSVTFASPDLGWVLGSAPCAAAPCTSIARTTDGGRTWAGIPAPRTPLAPLGAKAQAEAGSGVSGLRFADPLDGWAFGPDLWATHDGGSSWHRLSIPGAASATVVALEASGGAVQAVLFDQAVVRIASSPVETDGWRLSTVSVPIGAGPVPAAQLVLSGTSGWLMEVDRTVVGGARLSDGTWSAWTPPCLDLVGPAVLAASSPTELVAACDVGLWGTPQGEHLYLSHDGGASFARTGAPLPISAAGGVVATGAGSILVTGATAQGSALVRSDDTGQTWQTALETGTASITYLGFTTPTQGVVLTVAPAGSSGSPGGSLQLTRDGGLTWRQVSFAGQ